MRNFPGKRLSWVEFMLQGGRPRLTAIEQTWGPDLSSALEAGWAASPTMRLNVTEMLRVLLASQ